MNRLSVLVQSVCLGTLSAPLVPPVLLLSMTCLIHMQAAPANWNQFRGPNGSGVSTGCNPPLEIAADLASWRTPLPPGKSSPVLWGGRVFLTGLEGNRLATLALDARSGRVLWKRFAPEGTLERVHNANSVAASTPCADQESVYVYFGSYGLLSYDHDGHEQWKQAIPTPKSMYRVATSPILDEHRLILVLDDDEDLPGSRLSRSKVIALDTATGEPLWETPRPYNRGAWSTPMIWTHGTGTDLVVLGNGRAYGYDPTTGTERWYVNGFAREPISVPVAGNEQLYLSVSMQGGRGDVSWTRSRSGRRCWSSTGTATGGSDGTRSPSISRCLSDRNCHLSTRDSGCPCRRTRPSVGNVRENSLPGGTRTTTDSGPERNSPTTCQSVVAGPIWPRSGRVERGMSRKRT